MTLEEIRAVVSDCGFQEWRFVVALDAERPYLQIQFDTIDAVTDSPRIGHARKWFLSPYMTRSEIVQTALKAVLTNVEHEARESFRYRGRAIFGPHYDVDDLWKLSEKRSNAGARA